MSTRWLENLELFKICIKDDGTFDYTSLDEDDQKRICSWVNMQRYFYEKRENNEDTPMTDEEVRLLQKAKFNFKIELQSTRKKTKKKMVVRSKNTNTKVTKVSKGGGDGNGCKRVTKVSSKKRRSSSSSSSSSSSKGVICENFFNLNVAIGKVIHSNSKGVRSQGGGRFRGMGRSHYATESGKTPTTEAVDKATIPSMEAALTEAAALTEGGGATPASRETVEVKESTTPTPFYAKGGMGSSFTESIGAPTPTPTSRRAEEVKEQTNPTPSFTEGGMKPSSSSTFPLPQAVDSSPSATKKIKKQMSDDEFLAASLQNLKLLLLHQQTKILEQADANGCTPEFTQIVLRKNGLHAQGTIGIANRNKALLDKIQKKHQLKKAQLKTAEE